MSPPRTFASLSPATDRSSTDSCRPESPPRGEADPGRIASLPSPASARRFTRALARSQGPPPLYVAVVAVPHGSCTGTGQRAVEGSEDRDQSGRPTGVCPVCGGRFRLGGGALPNHGKPSGTPSPGDG